MTAPAKDLDLSILPSEYRVAFEAQVARVAALEAQSKRQEHLIAELQQALYGKKSEKLNDDDRQLAFEDLEVALAEVDVQTSVQAPEGDKPKRKKIAKRNRGNLPEDLPRIERVIEPDSLSCPCGCGVMHKIGEDRHERLDILPAQLRVIVTVRPKYACRSCTDGVTQALSPWLIACVFRGDPATCTDSIRPPVPI